MSQKQLITIPQTKEIEKDNSILKTNNNATNIKTKSKKTTKKANVGIEKTTRALAGISHKKQTLSNLIHQHSKLIVESLKDSSSSIVGKKNKLDEAMANPKLIQHVQGPEADSVILHEPFIVSCHSEIGIQTVISFLHLYFNLHL